jgi:hypothetical protein
MNSESPCRLGLGALIETFKFCALAEEALSLPTFNSLRCFCDKRCSMLSKILFCSQGDFPRWHEANLHPLCLKLALYRADCYSPREDRDPCSGLQDCFAAQWAFANSVEIDGYGSIKATTRKNYFFAKIPRPGLRFLRLLALR